MSEKTIILPSNPPGGSGEINYRLTEMVSKRRYLTYLRERWWVALICLVLTIGTVVIYETLRPETYSSFAQLYLTTGAQIGTSIFSEPKDDFATQIELLKGSRLRLAAWKNLGDATANLKDPIDVEVVRPMATSILQLKATGTDSLLSQRFLQELINEYLNFKSETRLSSTEDLVAKLTEELAKREKELKLEQENWAEFQKTNNLAVLQEESKSTGLFLADLNMQLARMSLEKELLEKGLGGFSEVSPALDLSTNSTELATSPSTNRPSALVSSDVSLKSAKVELAVKRALRDHLLTEPGGAQKVRQQGLDDAIKGLERTITALETANAAERQSALKEIEMRIEATTNRIPDWEAKVFENNDRLSQSQRILDRVQRQKDHYNRLLSLLQNVDLSKNMQQEKITILLEPSPGLVVPRGLPFRIFLAVVAGLFISMAIVFIWHLLDDRIASVHDLKEQFGETLLGLVPQIRVKKARPQEVLLNAFDSRSAYLESYRHLRSALLLSSKETSEGPQTLLLTSPATGEGKTTIAINLARVLARSGFRVLLVDADPQGGGLRGLIEMRDGPGLLDYLQGVASVKEVVQSTDDPRLNIVACSHQANPQEGLLLRPELDRLLKELAAGFDFVIVDGPPVLVADDAALLAAQADAVILIARPFFTKTRLLRRSLDMLYQRKTKQVFLVLNRARPDDWSGYQKSNGALRSVAKHPVLPAT